MNDDVSMIEWMVESCDVSSIKLMKGFSGTLNSCRRSSITSRAVSEAEQKKVAIFTTPSVGSLVQLC